MRSIWRSISWLMARSMKRKELRFLIKNLNSFRFIERAINHEIERQIDLIEGGGTVIQETRLYDPERDETRPMRTKEEANDYRYFPDPDLLPVEIDEALVETVRKTLPELPDAKRRRLGEQYGVKADDAVVLAGSPALADYFEAVAAAGGSDGQTVANWVLGELSAALNRDGLDITSSRIEPAGLAQLLDRIADGTLSGKLAKQVFEAMWAGEGDADAVIEAKGLKQITDSGEIRRIVEEVLAANPEQVEQYRGGKTKVVGFFVGQVMKATKGKANPGEVNRLLKAALDGN